VVHGKEVELTIVDQHLLRPKTFHTLVVDGSECRRDGQVEKAVGGGGRNDAESELASFPSSSSRRLCFATEIHMYMGS